MKLPKGKLIDTKRGGKGVLKTIIASQANDKFDGYIKILPIAEAREIDGTLIMKEGEIKAIIFEEDHEKKFKKDGLPDIVKESCRNDNNIEIHGLDPSIILDYYPEAEIEGLDISEIDKLQSQIAPAPQAEEVEEAGTAGPGPEGMEGEYNKLFKDSLKVPGKEEMTEEGETKPPVPEKPEEGGGKKGAEEEKEEKEEEGEEAEAEPSPEAVSSTEEATEGSGKTEGEAVPQPKPAPVPVEKGPAPTPTAPEAGAEGGPSAGKDQAEDGWGRLIEELVFDTFVVGENNRFTHAAAMAVAEGPAKAYNPLFIYGGVGLGKTHLLNAIGNYIKEQNLTSKVIYISIENFTHELIQAIRYDKVNDFRQRYANVDVLLIDDIQFIGGKDSTQEEFFYTFNELYKKHKQICIASDRLPKDIPKLEARLRSRFEGGLITDIKSPNFETRLAILKRRADQENVTLADDIMNLIAENITDNIRELEGALTKVIAYSTLTQREINIDLAKEALGDVLEEEEGPEGEKEEEAEAEGEEEKKSLSLEIIREGNSYLIEEDRLDLSVEITRIYKDRGKNVLSIARTNPRLLRDNFGMGKTNIMWLTDRDTDKEETITPSLESIVYYVEEFYSASDGKGFVFLDGLEYLISLHEFSPVARFIRQMIDITFEYDAIFIAPIASDVLKPGELKALEREMVPLTQDILKATGKSKSFAESVSKMSNEDEE